MRARARRGRVRPDPGQSAKLHAVALQKISGPEGTDFSGFVVVDLDDAPRADGVVRCAKKILVDGARNLARSRTYAWALLGEQVSGASAGISTPPDQRDDAVRTFVEAVTERVRSGELSLDPSRGLSRDDLAPLAEVDRRSPLRDEQRAHGRLTDELLATGALSAATAALGGLDGRRVALEGAGDALPALVSQLATAGAKVVAVGTGAGTVADPSGLDPTALVDAHREHGDGLTSALGSERGPAEVLTEEADVLMCGSRPGMVDHEVAAALPHQLLVPIGAVPVTAKALAVATRRDVVVLPDFLTAAGPLHAFRPSEAATADELVARAEEHAGSLTRELLGHDDGPLLAACYRAEDFLRSWRDELPFGRPLA